MIRQLALLSVLLVLSAAGPAGPSSSNCGLFCNLCQQGLGLVQKNIDAIEVVTHDQLIGLINKVCDLVPNLDLVKVVCDVARDDVVDGINKVLEFLKKSSNPEVTCHQIYLC